MDRALVRGPDPNHWNGRKVLVTGSTGFKGSWLSLWLSELGATVRGFALPPPTTPSLYGSIGLEQRIEQWIGDIRDANRVRQCVEDFGPQTVFHLAAQPMVRQGYRDPLNTFSTNILGTANVLDAVRSTKHPCSVVIVTSDKVYENREWPWGYRETDALGGHDPYSVSKACAELVTVAYRRSFFTDRSESNPVARVGVATARAGNVIGGGDFGAERIVPDAVRAFNRNATLVVRNPDTVRPWQFVLEPLYGYLRLAERLSASPEAYAEAWNFGPNVGAPLRVSELVTLVSCIWGETAQWSLEPARANQPHETTHLAVDATLARQRLQVKTQLSVNEMLEWSVSWYKLHASGASEGRLRMLCIEQLGAYADRAASA